MKNVVSYMWDVTGHAFFFIHEKCVIQFDFHGLPKPTQTGLTSNS